MTLSHSFSFMFFLVMMMPHKFSLMDNPKMGHLRYPYLALRSESMQHISHKILSHCYDRASSLLPLFCLNIYTLHPHNFSMVKLDLSKGEIINGISDEIIKSYLQCTWVALIVPLLLNLHCYYSAYLVIRKILR